MTNTSAGSGTPGAQRTQAYSVNLLNQYTNRTVPGYLEVNGSADAAASVTVNGASPSRQGEYYRQEVSVNNASAGLVQWLTSRATNTTGTSVVARLSFVPQTPEAFTHDADGNLAQDGLWNYTWDGENRLTRIETRTNAITDSNYWQRVDNAYDYQTRRIRKQAFTWNFGLGSWNLASSLRFFYDGWNLIGQVDEVTGTRLSFIWGTDLSGSMQGAGGVGGLKEMIVHNGPLAGTYFYSYDGNGNVAALVNAADGTEAARYEYGPFLELLRATGPLARLNPFRASTKYQDDETDLLYYGYRYLSTATGRWLGRDPMEEEGGVNPLGFVGNDPINDYDYFGLKGNGHHIVPWSIFNGAVSAEVQKFFDSDLARIFNDYYKTHNGATLDKIKVADYNRIVSEELEKFLGKTALKNMTIKQAEQFLNQIKNAPANSPIAIYNNAVRRDAAAAMKKALAEAAEKAAARSLEKAVGAGAVKSGSKLTKAIPLVGAVVAVYFYAEDAEAYGGGPAAVNTAIDSIPFLGTGKVISEAIRGYRFLDVTVGRKEVQPATSLCPK